MVEFMALCGEHLILKGSHVDGYKGYYIKINQMKLLKSKELIPIFAKL